VPPHSRAFVAAVIASIGGIVGLAVGGYGIDLVRLQRPDLELRTCVAMAVVGGIGWCVGLVLAWRFANTRPPTTSVDVALFLVGAAVAVWLATVVQNEMRFASFGPMIDDVDPRDPLLRIITTAYWVDATIVAFTLVALALTRESRRGRRTAR
jgi:hypothetical protein